MKKTRSYLWFIFIFMLGLIEALFSGIVFGQDIGETHDTSKKIVVNKTYTEVFEKKDDFDLFTFTSGGGSYEVQVTDLSGRKMEELGEIEVEDWGDEKEVTFWPYSGKGIMVSNGEWSYGSPAAGMEPEWIWGGSETLEFEAVVSDNQVQRYEIVGLGSYKKGAEVAVGIKGDYKGKYQIKILGKASEDSNSSINIKKKIAGYKITYDLKGGKNDKSNPKSYTSKKTVILKDAKKKGYIFQGWYNNKGKKVAKIKKGAKGDITLTAKWKAINYTIKFYKNSSKASGTVKDLKMTYGKKRKLPANAFKQKGYVFAGWSTKKKGKVEYKNKQNVTNLSAKDGAVVKLYAIWEKNVVKPSIQITKFGNHPSKYLTGKSWEFKAVIKNGTGKITWSTSNSMIATVDQKGKVTFHSPGKVTITASGAGVSDSLTLQVKGASYIKKEPVEVSCIDQGIKVSDWKRVFLDNEISIKGSGYDSFGKDSGKKVVNKMEFLNYKDEDKTEIDFIEGIKVTIKKQYKLSTEDVEYSFDFVSVSKTANARFFYYRDRFHLSKVTYKIQYISEINKEILGRKGSYEVLVKVPMPYSPKDFKWVYGTPLQTGSSINDPEDTVEFERSTKAKILVLADQDITLYSGKGIIDANEKYQLEASVLPNSTDNKTLKWKSGNTSIVRVTDKGVIEAVAPGKTQVKAVTTDGSQLSAVCNVTVKKMPFSKDDLNAKVEYEISEPKRVSGTTFYLRWTEPVYIREQGETVQLFVLGGKLKTQTITTTVNTGAVAFDTISLFFTGIPTISKIIKCLGDAFFYKFEDVYTEKETEYDLSSKTQTADPIQNHITPKDYVSLYVKHLYGDYEYQITQKIVGTGGKVLDTRVSKHHFLKLEKDSDGNLLTGEWYTSKKLNDMRMIRDDLN